MVDNDGSAPTPRRRPVVRLGVFAGFLPGMFYLVAVARVIDVAQVRRVILATGPAAPPTSAAVSAVLCASLFASRGGRPGGRAGRDSARALLGTKRADRIDARIERRGLWGVVGQRFVPGI